MGMLRMKFFPFFLFLSFLLFEGSLFAQNEDLQVGSAFNQYRQSQGAYFDYSDPEAVNIKVSVWGFVKFPGRYVIPGYSTVNDLLSFAGGPSDDAHLDDLRIYRIEPDSTQKLYKFSYNDLLWDDNLRSVSTAPSLNPGDILLVPGEPRLYFKDWFQISLSVISTLISLSILILNIVN
jgi:polysaccharide biosynthesis/export protein